MADGFRSVDGVGSGAGGTVADSPQGAEKNKHDVNDNHSSSSNCPADRIRRFRQELARRGLDAYIIPSEDPHMSEYPPDHYCRRAFISGFTGSAGVALISQEKALLFTDGRYFEQAER
jgi:hypothetical protein